MDYTTITYETIDRIAVITLNRPEKFNTIRPPMPDEVDKALETATRDPDVRVVFLQGAGKSFCAGYDFSGGLEHHKEYGFHADGEYDLCMDMLVNLSQQLGPTQKFMSIWRCPKPVVVKVHGWCVGVREETGGHSSHAARGNEVHYQPGL